MSVEIMCAHFLVFQNIAITLFVFGDANGVKMSIADFLRNIKNSAGTLTWIKSEGAHVCVGSAEPGTTVSNSISRSQRFRNQCIRLCFIFNMFLKKCN